MHSSAPTRLERFRAVSRAPPPAPSWRGYRPQTASKSASGVPQALFGVLRDGGRPPGSAQEEALADPWSPPTGAASAPEAPVGCFWVGAVAPLARNEGGGSRGRQPPGRARSSKICSGGPQGLACSSPCSLRAARHCFLVVAVTVGSRGP
eukprot:5902989-Alexandrium_andersonii.AAC.1